MSKKITFLLSISLSISLIVGLTVFFLGQQALGVTFGGAPSMGGNKITSLGTPGASADASTKGYIDSLSGVSGNFTVGGKVGIGGAVADSALYVSDPSGGGANIRLGAYVALGQAYSGAAAVFGDNVKADEASNNRMVNINTHGSYAGSAIWLQGNDGITFHTKSGSATAGAAYSSSRMKIEAGGDVSMSGEVTAAFTLRSMRSSGGSTPLCRAPNSPYILGYCTSLAEYKLNVKDLELGLDTIMQLTPREYDWIENGKHDLGLVAEEVELVNPLLAAYDGENGELSGVKYKHMVALLIKAMQEQQGEIEELKQEIKELKAILNK